MDIKEFVSKTLTQITEGVIEAQEKSGAKINPRLHGGESVISKKNAYLTSWDSIAQPIDFDIAVVTENSENKDAGGSIKVVGINLGGGVETKSQESVTSRVKFQVLVEFPQKQNSQRRVTPSNPGTVTNYKTRSLPAG